MRWDNLFQDLEAQLETVLGDEDADLARDSERARHASLSLAECLVDEFANHHRLGPMQLLTGGIYLWITVDNLGSDWISGEVVAPAQSAGYCIINLSRVDQVIFSPEAELMLVGTQRAAHRVPAGAARRLGRITFRIVLRDLARRRKSGWLRTSEGDTHGTFDRIGKDFAELATHSPRDPRRQELLESRVWVKLSAVCCFRLDD